MKLMLKRQIQWILQEKYNGKLTKAAKKDIERLEKGEPVDYIIGFVEFLGCTIDLSKKPLIPRVETEFWVEKAIENISNPSTRYARSGQNLRILDIFAGSGCIGVAVLKHIKNSHVTFIDLEEKNLEQIKINTSLIRANKRRYKIIQSNMFERVVGKYDCIFANPPYIPELRKTKVQKSVLKYEPKMALFGGGDGLFYIRKFLASAKNFLVENGKIYMEFDSIQKTKIEKLLKKLKYQKWEFHKDQYRKWRWVVGG